MHCTCCCPTLQLRQLLLPCRSILAAPSLPSCCSLPPPSRTCCRLSFSRSSRSSSGRAQRDLGQPVFASRQDLQATRLSGCSAIRCRHDDPAFPADGAAWHSARRNGMGRCPHLVSHQRAVEKVVRIVNRTTSQHAWRDVSVCQSSSDRRFCPASVAAAACCIVPSVAASEHGAADGRREAAPVRRTAGRHPHLAAVALGVQVSMGCSGWRMSISCIRCTRWHQASSPHTICRPGLDLQGGAAQQ